MPILQNGQQLEVFASNRLVFAVRDFLKENDKNLFLSDAIKLRDAIRMDDSADMDAQYYQNTATGGKIDAFLKDNGYDTGKSFADHLAVHPESSPSAIAGDFNRLIGSLTGYNMEGYSIVDTFGNYGETGRRSATLDSVHSLINDDRNEQEAVYKASRWNSEEEVRYYRSTSLTGTDSLINYKGNLYVFGQDGLKQPNRWDRTVSGQNPVMSFYANTESEYDITGISELRPYMKTEEYERLKEVITPGTLHRMRTKPEYDPAKQKQAIENAKDILEFLNDNGYSYSILKDLLEGEYKAKIDDLNYEVRLIDMANPQHVGRVHGDNLDSHISTETAKESNYMPDQADVISLLMYRLGYSVTPSGSGYPRNYFIGQNAEVVGMNGNVLTDKNGIPYKTDNYADQKGSSNKDINEMDQDSKSKDQDSKSKNQYSNSTVLRTVLENDREVPVYIRTKLSDLSLSSIIHTYDLDESLAKLSDMMGQARENLKNSVFGELTDELSEVSVEGEENRFDNYKTSPNPYLNEELKDGFAVNSEGERIRLGSRFTDGVSFAFGDEVTNYLKDAYTSYLSADTDAFMMGVIEGEVRYETRQEFKERIKLIRELEEMDLSEGEKRLLGTIFPDDTPDSNEKLSNVKAHFLSLTDSMIGSIPEEGPIQINAANIERYGSIEEKDLLRLVKTIKSTGREVEFISEFSDSDDFSQNRLSEMCVSYNEKAAKPLLTVDSSAVNGFTYNHANSVFMNNVASTIAYAMMTSGCTVDAVDIDDHGIIHYQGTREYKHTFTKPKTETSTKQERETKFFDEKVEGYIGQVFAPDEMGVITTNFDYENEKDNRSIIPGYNAYIIKGDGSMEKRSRLKGYEQMMYAGIANAVRTQILTYSSIYEGKNQIKNEMHSRLRETDPLDMTRLNRIYRRMNSFKLEHDYMSQYQAKGYSPEEITAHIKTLRGSVSYSKDLENEATINADIKAKKSNFVNDLNMDGYSLARRNISVMQDSEPGYYDSGMTQGNTGQGNTRTLNEHTKVKINGEMIPSPVPGDHSAMLNLAMNRNNEFNPPDRQQMTGQNIMHSLRFGKAAKVAQISFGGWTMDDANVISKTFAEKHLVPTDSIEAVKLTDPAVFDRIIEKNDPSQVNSIERGEHETKIRLMGRDFVLDNSQPFGLQIKEQILKGMEEGIPGLRPLAALDKISDFNGNKGVISLVVDPEISDEEADRLQIRQAVALFKANPTLDVVSPPYSIVSRFNGGTVRGMMESPEDLVVPDGMKVNGRGAMGTIPLIITDKTADEKVKIYDDEAFEDGKGRKASSQGAWQLQARGAEKIMNYFYGSNKGIMTDVREKLLAIGLDIGNDYQLKVGYEPHVLANGEPEKRPIIMPEPLEPVLNESRTEKGTLSIKNNVSIGQGTGLNTVERSKEKIMATGGFLSIPFPIKMKDNPEIVTRQDPEHPGRYLLPVLPPAYRTEKKFSDGRLTVNKYTRQYNDIIKKAMEYDLNAKFKAMVEERYAAEINTARWKKAAGTELTNDEKRILDTIAKPEKAMASDIRQATSDFNKIRDDIVSSNFNGKYNIWKHGVMTNRIPNSATIVWAPDPRLRIDEILLNKENAEKMNLKEGDKCVVWRDPLLRAEGITYMKVKIAEEGRVFMGCAINPAMDKRFDGDFDGDTVAVVSLHTATIREREFIEEFDKLTDRNKQSALIKEYDDIFKNKNRTAAIEQIREKIAKDAELHAEAEEKLSVASTMIDMGPTSLHLLKEKEFDKRLEELSDKEGIKALVNGYEGLFKDKDELMERLEGLSDKGEIKALLEEYKVGASGISLAINDGLDVASGYAVMGDVEKTLYEELMQRSKEMILAAKESNDPEKTEEALKLADQAIHLALDNSYGSDIVQYGSFKDFLTSMNTIIVDHKAKGKIGKMEDVAAYINIEAQKIIGSEYNYAHPGDLLHYNYNEKGEKVSIDVDVPIVDFRYPAIRPDLSVHPILEENGIKTEIQTVPAEHENHMLTKQKDMERRYREVQLSTAIKSFGTGIAGKYSQRAIKVLRDYASLPALEVTYGATQGILQAKHDAKEALQKYVILRDVLPALWKGNQIAKTENGWVAVRDDNGKPVKVDKEQWVEQYHAICNDKEGLNFEIAKSQITEIAEGLYRGGEFLDVYADGTGGTLDRLAYSEKAEVLYDCCRSGANLFDSSMAGQFLPNMPFVEQTEHHVKQIIQDLARVYIPEKAVERAEVMPDNVAEPREDIMDPEPSYNMETPGQGSAGLYFRGELVLGWAEMIGQGRASADGDTVRIHDVSGADRLVIPEGYSVLERDGSINGKDGLISVSLPESMQVIGSNAFEECRNLRSVEVGSSIDTIEERAFKGCLALEELSFGRDTGKKGTISIPDSLSYVGNEAFLHCPNIVNVEYNSEHTGFGSNVFIRMFDRANIEEKAQERVVSRKMDMEMLR